MLDTKAIVAPVLAIAGGSDQLAPPRAVTMLHAGILQLKDELIAGIGHSTHWEAPARVSQLVCNFLGQG
jgi:pimeloyl-ACP methyl ester carboxylesterase